MSLFWILGKLLKKLIALIFSLFPKTPVYLFIYNIEILL